MTLSNMITHNRFYKRLWSSNRIGTEAKRSQCWLLTLIYSVLGGRRYTYTGTTMYGRPIVGRCRTHTIVICASASGTDASDRPGLLLVEAKRAEQRPVEGEVGVMRRLFTAWGSVPIHERHRLECWATLKNGPPPSGRKGQCGGETGHYCRHTKHTITGDANAHLLFGRGHSRKWRGVVKGR